MLPITSEIKYIIPSEFQTVTPPYCLHHTTLCAILDSRVNSHGSYRSKVLAALPKCRVTSDILEVREFICCKKSRGYFM